MAQLIISTLLPSLMTATEVSDMVPYLVRLFSVYLLSTWTFAKHMIKYLIFMASQEVLHFEWRVGEVIHQQEHRLKIESGRGAT